MPRGATDTRSERPEPEALRAPDSSRRSRERKRAPASQPGARGFGASGGGSRDGQRRGNRNRRRGPALSRGDWGPLGKHPDLEAIIARQRLQLPLSGRLTEAQVNQAWKRCAGEHHPDRGGAHDAMQQVNGARDLLLGRDLD